MRVLLVEDNADIVANVHEFLEPLGYELDCARSGHAALALAARESYDAIVLDLMLPGIHGLEVCRKLRNEMDRETPVLMLTAKDTVQDKVAGFQSGADDYLVKPFLLAELDARLKALVRRSREPSRRTVLVVADLRFDMKTFCVTREGRRIDLTPTGYKMLACLMRAAPAIVTRELLEQAVWGHDPPQSDALRTHIHSLRQALDRPFAFPMLETLPGIGYRLVKRHAT